jgi:basic membrane protein A
VDWPVTEEEATLRIPKRLLALGATAAILFAACGGAASPSPSEAPASQAPASQAPASQAPASEAPMYKGCVAFDTGGLGDKGFNDLAMKGLEDAKAAGFDTAFAEAQGAADYAANIQRLIDQGCQTVVTVGFTQGSATAAATLANPDINFGQVDATWNPCGDDFTCGTADDPPPGVPANFTGLDFQIDEAAMLAGYLAAGFSTSGKIGTYGGAQFPGVTRFMDGLYAGIAYYNEQKGTSVVLLGWDGDQTGTFVGGDNPWNDPTKGEQLAQTFLDQGVDIVHPVSGATGNGTLKAMLAAGKWGIGVDTDQAISLAEYAGAILTSAEKVIDVAVLELFKKNAAGDTGGEDFIGTLANGGVRLSPFHELDDDISADLKAEIEALRQAISSGSVKVCDYLARGC